MPHIAHTLSSPTGKKVRTGVLGAGHSKLRYELDDESEDDSERYQTEDDHDEIDLLRRGTGIRVRRGVSTGRAKDKNAQEPQPETIAGSDTNDEDLRSEDESKKQNPHETMDSKFTWQQA